MEEVKEIVKRLTRNKFIEKTVQCMEICGHRWMVGEDEFRVPTKKEVKATIEWLVEMCLKNSMYYVLDRKVEAHGGGIEVLCECTATGHAWSITYTGHSQNSYTEEKN